MEIPEKRPLPPPPVRNRPADAKSQRSVGSPGAQSKTLPTDTVSLTTRGREFKAAGQHAQLLTETREDRILRLKRQLEDGTYRVQGRRIAVNMINETLENNHVLKHIDTQA